VRRIELTVINGRSRDCAPAVGADDGTVPYARD
jgi:hypothetical protein